MPFPVNTFHCTYIFHLWAHNPKKQSQRVTPKRNSGIDHKDVAHEKADPWKIKEATTLTSAPGPFWSGTWNRWPLENQGTFQPKTIVTLPFHNKWTQTVRHFRKDDKQVLCSAITKTMTFTHSATDASVILLCSVYFFNLTTKNCIHFHSISANGCPN